MSKKIKILGIAGSLRKQSYNRALLEAALEVLPPNCSLEIFDLEDIPLYNQDKEGHFPPSVLKFKATIRAADAILIATPEYNYSIPGVLKNAIDWASRPYGDSAWDNKPVAIMGATVGNLGTSRAQYHLRQILLALNMHALNKPELMVSSAQDKFDQEGKLIDSNTRKKIGELLEALVQKVSE
ncbi:MAG: NADPH-dependent FMN reductase [Chlamydiia bacterium]